MKTYGETGVVFYTEDGSLAKLVSAAEVKCAGNVRFFDGRKVLIEGGGYHKVWLETQPMGGAMYAKRDLEVAYQNQVIFMDYQRPDGRLPGSVALEGGKCIPQFDKFQGFCFPAEALDVYYLIGKDADYLSQLYEVLERFDQYLWEKRDSDGDGCLESFCRYDTGEDEAVRYGDAPNAWVAEEPPTGCQVVPMASMDFMGFSYAARETLSQIAGIWGKDDWRQDWEEKAAQVRGKIREYLWDEEKGTLFDRDKNHRKVDVLCHNPLRVMYFNALGKREAGRFVREHLLNPAAFWTKMPLPSVAVNDPAFVNAPSNNWSGQCEALTYQRTIRALENYGYYKLIPVLGQKLMEAVATGGIPGRVLENPAFTQQYDPFTMVPSTVTQKDGYGPAILSVLEYVSRMYGVHVVRDKLVWSTYGSIGASYEQFWEGHRYRVEMKGGKAAGYIDGTQVFGCGRGERIVTDLEGKILCKDRLE